MHMGYEVRVMRSAQWRVEGIFDDEALAIAAAKKAEDRYGEAIVMVVQEIYDAARNKVTSRNIYRTARNLTAAQTNRPRQGYPSGAIPEHSGQSFGGVRLRSTDRACRHSLKDIWPWIAMLTGAFVMLSVILITL